MTIGAFAVGAVAVSGSESAEANLPISLRVRIVITAGDPITLPVVIRIGATQPDAVMPVRVRIVSDAAIGGLGGAGGWPAAASGKWKPVVILDGSPISKLVGSVVVNHADDEARTAEFSFIPDAVLQPMSLTGRRVEIGFAERDDSGSTINYQVMFRGVVDVPSIDLTDKTVTCTCHDQMQEILAATDKTWIDANIGGRWREEVSGVPADNREYAEARRASVPVSLALDSSQSLRVIPWRGVGLRNLSIKQADIWDGTQSIDLPSRDDIRTRIVCRMQYRYEQLRSRGAVAQYAQPLRFFIGDTRGTKNDKQKLWLTTAMVNGAIESLSGWNVESLVVTNPKSGSTLVGETASEGIYIISDSVAPELALGFTARLSTRWQQTVTQDYTVEVVLPDLETALGAPVSEEIGATVTAEFDADNWQNDITVEPVISTPLMGDNVVPWQPAGYSQSDADEVLRTLLDQAWVKLWGYQRSGRLSFEMPLNPVVWLDCWASFQSDSINAAGKVVSVEHRMDIDSGDATTVVSIAVGLPGNTDASQPSWTIPAIPSVDYTRPPEDYSVEIGTYVGGLSTSPPFDESWIGFITNLDGSEIAGRNWYDRKLSMKTPDVIAEDRDAITLTASSIIETTVPTDLLELL